MSDNGLWAKLWFESLIDAATANLSEHQWTWWTKLMVIVKHLGTQGELTIRPPAHQICGMLHVTPNVTIGVTDGYTELCHQLRGISLPNFTVTFNDSGSLHDRYITVKFLKWTRYQGDYSTERVAKFRAKNTVTCNDRHLSSTSHSSSVYISKKKKEGVQGKPKENGSIPYASVLASLNLITGAHFKDTPKFRALILARWNEGFREADFESVTAKKTKHWKGTEQEQYLRPETLFGPKMDGYRNQPDEIVQKSKQKRISAEEVAEYAKKHGWDKLDERKNH